MGIIEFFYLVAVLIAGILATAGYGMLSLSPADFRNARRCFWASALLFLGIGVVWGLTTVEPAWVRIPAVGVIGLIAAIGLSEGLRWISGRESASVSAPAITPMPFAPLMQPAPPPVVETPILQPPPAPIVTPAILSPPATSDPPPTKPENKVFADPHVTPDFLVGLYKTHTVLGAETLIKKYIGKWILVTGPLGEVIGGYPVFGTRSAAVGAFDQKGPSVLMLFRDEWIDRISIIPKGQIISVRGKIETVERTKITLENCELVDSNQN
jgi:hypothetical protein